ncbi:MAG: hypothetical protein QM749_07660 [Aquabacterium sp.]
MSKPCDLTTAKVVFDPAGPGEADLITVRGSRLLAQAHVVLFDVLLMLPDRISRRKRSGSTWAGLFRQGRQRLQRPDAHQPAAGRAIAGYRCHPWRRGPGPAARGRRPDLFGRLEEELHVLHEAGIACEVVPGVTSALAAAAATNARSRAVAPAAA